MCDGERFTAGWLALTLKLSVGPKERYRKRSSAQMEVAADFFFKIIIMEKQGQLIDVVVVSVELVCSSRSFALARDCGRL